MGGRHPLLRRQLRRAFGEAPPDGLGPFVDAVDDAYARADADREMLERSLDLTSQELMEQNARLRAELAEREAAQRRLEREAARHRETASARDAAVDARDAAEELLRLRSSFLANMSHELRTPLTGILGFADLLSDEVEGEAADMVAVVRRGAQRLYDTVNSVLDLAQLDSGAVTLELGPTDVRAEAADVAALLGPVAERKGLALTAEAGPPAWAVAEPAAVGRVLTNLVGNALKFTQAGGVAISVRAGEGGAEVRVRDTGPGIAEAFRPHLFDAFRQASSGYGRTHEGNGLGLAITARLVELMGGAVAVEDTSPSGTTFLVRLRPAASPAAPRAVPAAASA